MRTRVAALAAAAELGPPSPEPLSLEELLAPFADDWPRPGLDPLPDDRE